MRKLHRVIVCLSGSVSRPRKGKGKGSSPEESPFILEDAIHASENALNDPAHVFEVGGGT